MLPWVNQGRVGEIRSVSRGWLGDAASARDALRLPGRDRHFCDWKSARSDPNDPLRPASRRYSFVQV